MGSSDERNPARASAPGIPSLSSFLVSPATFGRPVCRLGLATRGDGSLTPDDVHHALERGVNFLNWPGWSEGPREGDAVSQAVSSLGRAREDVVVCMQLWARSAAEASDELQGALKVLGSDYIDVATLYYVEQQKEWDEITSPGGSLPYLKDAQSDGVVRRIGLTSHQRKLAAEIVATGELDALMIRYNAAHRGAESDVFPVAEAHGVPVITYTSLRWGALLRSTPADPPNYTVARPPAWYRFVLQNPCVAVALAAPANRAELDEDLNVLTAGGRLSEAEFSDLALHGERVRRRAGAFQ